MFKQALFIIACSLLIADIKCDTFDDSVSVKSILKTVPHLNSEYPVKRVSFADDSVLPPLQKLEHPLSSFEDTDDEYEQEELQKLIQPGSDDSIDIDYETQYDENDEIISKALMNDYDSSMRKWRYGNYTFHFYIDAFTHVHELKRKAMMMDRNTMIPTKLRLTSTRSYLKPNGGVDLRSPFIYGVRFSDTQLKWEAFIPLPQPLLDELTGGDQEHDLHEDEIVIGHFTNSRNAAIAYNTALWHLQLKSSDYIKDLFEMYKSNRVTHRERAFVDFQDVKAQVDYCLFRMQEAFGNDDIRYSGYYNHINDFKLE